MKKCLLAIALLMVTFFLGGISVKLYPRIKSDLISQFNKWHFSDASNWNNSFKLVKIPSTSDGEAQHAYFLPSAEKMPLLVSLHTWSGDFSQADPLAELALNHGWNYIHPDFRGSNRRYNSCLNPLVITDVDDAIQYAIDNSNVDVGNIFVVGVSGGGYVALGSYLKTKHKIKRFLTWAPISDLSDWYQQSLALENYEYAGDILSCTSSGLKSLDEQEAKNRSPLHFTIPAVNSSFLDIYAGIDDGHIGTGSVPISHSLLFFNNLLSKMGMDNSKIDFATMSKLLTRAVNRDQHDKKIGDRAVIYQRLTPKVTLTVFDGGHEMLPEYTFEQLKGFSKSD